MIADDDGKLRVIEDITVKSKQEDEKCFTPKLKNPIEKIMALKEDPTKPQILCLQALSKKVYLIDLDCSQSSEIAPEKKKKTEDLVEVNTTNNFFKLMD